MKMRALLLGLLLLITIGAQAQKTVMPVPRIQFLDTSGNPLASGKLHTFVTLTTTPLATFTDSGGGTPNANPVILDAGGFASVWLTPGTLYTFQLDNSADVLQWTEDNVSTDNLLNLANTWTTLQTFSAGIVSTTTGEKLNNIRFCDQFAGANAGVKIAACITDLPSTGGVADARGLEGAQIIAQDVFSGITKPVRLLLGAATFTTTAIMGPEDDSCIEGISKEATIIFLANAVDIATVPNVIQNADASGGNSHICVRNLTIDVNRTNTTGDIRGIRFENTDFSLVESVLIKNCRLNCMIFREGSDHNLALNVIADTFGTGSAGHAFTIFRNSNYNKLIGTTALNGQASTIAYLIDDATTGDASSAPSNYNQLIGISCVAVVDCVDLEGDVQGHILNGVSIDGATGEGIELQTGNIFDLVPKNTIISNVEVNDFSGSGAAINVTGQGVSVSHVNVDSISGAGNAIKVQNEGSGADSSNISFEHINIRDVDVGYTGNLIRIAPKDLVGLSLKHFQVAATNTDESVLLASIGSGGDGNSADWVFDDFYVDTAAKHAIEVTLGTEVLNGLTISNLVARNPSTKTSNTFDGINITGTNLTQFFVRNVHAIDDRGGSAKMRYGVRIGSGSACHIANIQSFGHQTAAISNLCTSKSTSLFDGPVTLTGSFNPLEGDDSNIPRWIFKQVDHTDMTAAATADTFTLWTLPANTMIHDVVGTVVVAWEAVVGLSVAVCSVGTAAGGANDLTLDDNFFAAATVYELHDATASGGKGTLLFDATDKFAPFMLVASGDIEIQCDLTGDDHADTNAGQARVYILVSQPLSNTTTEAN